VLKDGLVLRGKGFGYPSDAYGEVVFNTGMVGYTETLTDPSYRGQILTMTYPLIGNYGVPDPNVKDQFGLPRFFESRSIQVRGLIVHELSSTPSHWSSIKTLDQWLYEQKIPGLYGIDTRELTKRLRVSGVTMGAISVSLRRSALINRKSTMIKKGFKPKKESVRLHFSKVRHRLDTLNYELNNFMPEVSVEKVECYPATDNHGKRRNIVIIDTGTKLSIIRNILSLGFSVTILPWNSPYESVKSHGPLGVVISNGPGDPKICGATINTARRLIEESVPTLGICLGNQILALAAGAVTYKLKYGHRGQNKPCIDLNSNTTYMTSQNHGYGIDPQSLEKSQFRIWFYNPDDDTVEGIQHEYKPIIGVQFHPEASPGPYDCMFVFERFKDIIDGYHHLTTARTLSFRDP
jgi:carbamoyl-phosphate synthase small subunit